MKKLCLIVCISMTAILGFAAVTWALEASVFDKLENIIVRAYTTPGTDSDCQMAQVGPPCYSAYIEVRDAEGTIIPPDKLVVTGINLTPTENPENPFQIHDNDLTDPEISMSINIDTGRIYIFCTDTRQGLHVMKYKIGTLFPVDGVCGTSNDGGPFILTPPNLCSAGRAIEVNNSSGWWTWKCEGVNDGTDSEICSATAPVNGACGTAAGVASATMPSANLCSYTATTPTVANNGSGSWIWSCIGLNTGTTDNCSAPIPSTGKPDLVVTSFSGIGSSYEAGYALRLSVTITNQGTASTAVANACANKQIAVKSYEGGTITGTWYVSDLAVGQTMSYVFNVTAGTVCSIHAYCSFTARVDANNCITESNEGNNSRGRSSLRGR